MNTKKGETYCFLIWTMWKVFLSHSLFQMEAEVLQFLHLYEASSPFSAGEKLKVQSPFLSR